MLFQICKTDNLLVYIISEVIENSAAIAIY